MLSLSKYSRSNAVNREWTEMYLDEAHTKGVLPVRCHCNVTAWAEDREELRRVKNDTGSQLAMMECTPRHNTVDAPVLYWAGIPGNAGDFPAEESFYTFWNRPSVSLRLKPITGVLPARSASVWLIAGTVSPCMLTSATCR